MELCALAGVTRSAYYRWLRNPASISERKNDELAAIAERIHSEHPDMGYRRLGDELSRECGFRINDKRILRLCRAKKLQSTIKWKPVCCTRGGNGSQMSLNSSITMMKMCTRSTSAQSSISMIGA